MRNHRGVCFSAAGGFILFRRRNYLLAHGKRVLVTCQAERALRVLGDMIRDRLPQIAPLCVSVIGGDARSRKELEESIYGISDPPIVTIRVPNGRWKDDAKLVINEPEAKAIVAKIKELCEDNRYEKLTMGVISLQGMDQAYLIESMLRDAIGEEEMLRRKLICGDSKHFQGDERNVMFLSMVAAPDPRPGALGNKFAEQRFNVAASRARDQLWLFHSIDFGDLNPNCMRYRLLQYCLDPKRAQHEMDKAEEIFKRYGSSKFHRDVHKLIVARGYRAIPEFKVGTHPYRIDIVIEGIHSRLAVECDGDEWHGIDRWEADQERQMVLERVGWKFWRVRGSSFYWNPDKAIEPLWHILEDMEILPVVR